MFKARISRWGSPALFVGIVLAFLLPFATVSCDGDEVTFTGAQLALGQVPEEENYKDNGSLAEQVETESTFWALVALASAATGLGLGIARRRGGGIAAAVGLLAMLVLAFLAATTFFADVDLHAGYVLSLLAYLAAATSHARAAWRRRRAARGTPPRAKRRRRRAAVAAVLVVLTLGAIAGCGALVVTSDDYAEPEYVDFDTADAGPAWSPDGREIAFERDGAVYTVKPDGSCPRRLTAGGAPAFSPKGDLLAVTRCDDETCSIVVVSRDGSEERELVAGPFSWPSWSADGTHVYLSHEEEDLSTTTWVVRADGTELRRLAPPWVKPDDSRWSLAAASEDGPTVSPDGTSYAFASSDDPTVGIDGLQEAIFVRSVDGGERRQLSDPENAGDYEPAWSPNGKLISFQRSGEIAVMDADGSNERVLTQVNGAGTSAWSPDSRELVFMRALYGGSGYFSDPSALMIVDVESRNVRQLTWGPEPVAACGSPG